MRAVAVVEAAKAAVVLLAGFGLLSLIHRDVQEVAENIIRHTHLDPASKYPRIFIDAADRVTDGQLWFFASMAALYAIIRSVEAYGLWNERRWAEWFALISCAIYLPVEIYEMWHRFTSVKAGIFLSNMAIALYMAYALRHSADQDRELALAKLAKAEVERAQREHPPVSEEQL